MLGTGYFAHFAACVEIRTHPNFSQVPHWEQRTVPGMLHNTFMLLQCLRKSSSFQKGDAWDRQRLTWHAFFMEIDCWLWALQPLYKLTIPRITKQHMLAEESNFAKVEHKNIEKGPCYWYLKHMTNLWASWLWRQGWILCLNQENLNPLVKLHSASIVVMVCVIMPIPIPSQKGSNKTQQWENDSNWPLQLQVIAAWQDKNCKP